MADAEILTRALGGRWYRGYGLAFCPAHDNTQTPALSLGTGRDGRLLLRCHTGCDFLQVMGALRARGLETGTPSVTPMDPARDATRRATEKLKRERQIRLARTCWSETVPIGGTLAERYLRRRGIRCALPGSLSFHPACWHAATASKLPAMVGAVVHTGEIVAVHRTYLAEPGAKANIEPNKAMLGPVGGGAVPLSRGPGPLVVAEGIETALSLLGGLADHAPRVWAALSASGMSGLLPPPWPSDLVIAPDGDPPGRSAADVLAARAYKLGWRVRVMEPPVPFPAT